MSKSAKGVLTAVILGGLALGGWTWLSRQAGHTPAVMDESQPHDYYTCSMHPSVHMHDPGQCPICGMTLMKVKSAANAGAKRERKILYYRSPMNAEVTSPAPAIDEMGMPFVPVYDEGESKDNSTVEGRGTVTLTAQKLQLIGVRYGKVERGTIGQSIRAYGRVAYDPELYQAQEEYLSALDLAELSKEAPLAASRERSARLLNASETRLRLLGLNDEQIRRLRDRRQVDPGLLLGAMESGKVWVYADVYESDLSSVRGGLAIDVEATAYPGRVFSGKIQAIDSVLNPQTRTIRIRSEVQDKEGLLKPDMYVNVTIHSDFGSGLSVPEEAVLNSGNLHYVFVNRGEGRLEPRKVRVGRQAEGRVEVLEGVAEGEDVVISGNFLIDSESRLRAGISGMTFYGGREAAEGKGK